MMCNCINVFVFILTNSKQHCYVGLCCFYFNFVILILCLLSFSLQLCPVRPAVGTPSDGSCGRVLRLCLQHSLRGHRRGRQVPVPGRGPEMEGTDATRHTTLHSPRQQGEGPHLYWASKRSVLSSDDNP